MAEARQAGILCPCQASELRQQGVQNSEAHGTKTKSEARVCTGPVGENSEGRYSLAQESESIRVQRPTTVKEGKGLGLGIYSGPQGSP